MSKKIILFAVLTAFITVGSFAQSPLKYGVKAGLNINSISGDEFKDYDSKIGFHVGATVEYEFTPIFGLQSGLLLNTWGASASETENEGGVKAEYTTSLSALELQLPVFATATFSLSDALKLKVHVGPTFGFGLSGNLRSKLDISGDTGNVDVSDWEFDEKDDIYKKEDGDSLAKRLNIGLGAGVSVLYNNWSLGVGYNLGLTNLNGYSDESDDAFKANSFLVSVGYNF
jgi:hypothetical protein